MKKAVKPLSLLLIFVLLISCLSGCGSSNPSEAAEPSSLETSAAAESSSPETSSPETSSPETPDAETAAPVDSSLETAAAPNSDSPFVNADVQLPFCDEVTSVSVWTYMLPPIIDYVAEDYSQNVTYSYLEEVTNVHADVTAISLFQATEALTIAVAAGDLMDITVGLQQFYPNGVAFVYDSGLLVDLVEYEDIMPNYFGILNADPDLYRDVLTDDGVLPYCYQLDENINIPQGSVIRSDWLAEVNMAIPQTYDEMHDVLAAIKSEVGVEYPLWFSPTGGTINAYLANGFGVSNSDFYMVVDGQVKFSPLESGFYDYLSLIHNWYEDKLISPDFVNGTLDSMPDDDKMADYAVYLINRSGYTSVYNLDPNAEITPIPDMVQNVGDTHHISGSSGSRAKNLGAAISAEASNIELCCKYLDYFYSEEGTYAAFFGQQGITYEFDENGNAVYTEMITNHPNLDLSFAALTYCEQQSAGVLLSGIDSILYGQSVVDAMDVWASIIDTDTWDYPSMATLTTEETETYSGIYSDIETYVQEMMLKFIIGTSSLDSDYAKFQETLETMGIQQCIDLKQTALDRYYSR